jgi:hypothetical protein
MSTHKEALDAALRWLIPMADTSLWYIKRGEKPPRQASDDLVADMRLIAEALAQPAGDLANAAERLVSVLSEYEREDVPLSKRLQFAGAALEAASQAGRKQAAIRITRTVRPPMVVEDSEGREG